MAKEKTPEYSAAPSDETLVTVTVTVLPSVRGRPLRERLGGVSVLHRARITVALALVLLALGAIIATAALQSSRASRLVGARRAQAQDSQRAAIAAAFGFPYPLRCLAITISASNPNYARADVDRTNGCGRYEGYLDASFHRVDGAWRLVIDEGQLFVSNSLLVPCSAGGAGCARAGATVSGKGGQSRTAGSVRVGTPNGDPLGCLSLAIALYDPRFARADFDRSICMRARPG